MEKTERLMSLDALRGFDMFFIIGGAALIVAFARFCGAADSSWIIQQMGHVPWAGFHHHDTIFPLFLFLAGVSWPFSLAGQRKRGLSETKIHLRILKRAAILVLLGMSFGGLLKFEPNFRMPSVLGFIGCSWAVASVLYIHVKGRWPRLLLAPLALILYDVILLAFAAPTDPSGAAVAAGADHFARETSIVSWLDRLVMKNHICGGVYDPESFFALLGGVATALLGMGAGTLLRLETVAGGRKALYLLGASLCSLAVSFVFQCLLATPVVKALWTPSFVCAAAAYSFAMLALFYWIVDVLKFRKWTYPFTVIGMNSILAYTIMMIGAAWPLKSYLFAGLGNFVNGHWPAFTPVVNTFCLLFALWLILWFCKRKGVFLKV